MVEHEVSGYPTWLMAIIFATLIVAAIALYVSGDIISAITSALFS
jgi:hypothetical protein